MLYEVIMMPRAIRDLDSLSPEVARRILGKIDAMKDDLAGDVKRLVHFSPAYRLRVGDYRVLFDLQANRILVQTIKHRREVYDR
jgi:mRNA interferase RelE/StbE